MHIPVMKDEVLRGLRPKTNEDFIDATLGLAGHAREILEQTGPNGKVLGIERDPEIIRHIESHPRLLVTRGSYIEMERFAEEAGIKEVSGILFDLGINSLHVDDASRGFSFLQSSPLDMRFSPDNEITAATIVNQMGEDELISILRVYGEEQYARRIAGAIVEARKIEKIETTDDLVAIIKKSTPVAYQRGRRHPATKTFQALRLTVNDELKHVEEGIRAACDLVKSGGRVVVISFHSLEHRITKRIFKEYTAQDLGFLPIKSVVKPGREEVITNPRARSAQIRIWEKN